MQGALLFSKKVKKDLPPVLPLNTKLPVTVTYKDDYYLLWGGAWGGNPFPFYWKNAECREGAEWKGQSVRSREPRSAWDCQYSLALLGQLEMAQIGWWETRYPSRSSTGDGFSIF